MRKPLPRTPYLAAAAGVIGFTLVLWIYHPGSISSDGVDQLNQGRSGIYWDWHPPLMAWLWGRLDRLWPGAIGMLVLQTACFWVGVALLSALSLKGPWAPAVCLLIGLFPPCFALLGDIWKDVQMGAALTLGFALLCLGERRGSKGWLAASLVPVFYAAAVRHNGPLVALPLLAWVGWLLADRPATGLARARVALAVAAGFLLMVLAIQRINRTLTHGTTGYPHQMVMLQDLTGLSLDEGEMLLPEPWRDEASLDRLAELYRRDDAEPLFWATSPGPSLRFSVAPTEISALDRAWFQAVRHHPWLYLRDRLAAFRMFLALRTSTAPYAIFVGVDPNQLGIAWHWSEPCRWLTDRFIDIRNWLIFRPFLYLFTELATLAWLLWRRTRTLALPLVLSGLLNTLPYLFVGPLPEFRYVWWTVVSTLLLPLGWRLGRLDRATPQEAPVPAAQLPNLEIA